MWGTAHAVLAAEDYVDGDFKLHDHSEYKWVKKGELLNYDLAPADIPLAKFVMEVNK